MAKGERELLGKRERERDNKGRRVKWGRRGKGREPRGNRVMLGCLGEGREEVRWEGIVEEYWGKGWDGNGRNGM